MYLLIGIFKSTIIMWPSKKVQVLEKFVLVFYVSFFIGIYKFITVCTYGISRYVSRVVKFNKKSFHHLTFFMSTVILYIYNIYVSTKLRVYNGGHQKMEFLPKYSKESLYISVSQLLSAFSPRAGPRFSSAVKLIKKEINSFIPASVQLWRSFLKPQRNMWNIAVIVNITDLSCGIGSTSEDTKA